MQKTKVYDLPTRLFHWLFAGVFLSAFFIAKVIDDESPAYSYHMLLGLVLVFAVWLRIIWGFVGSRYARFSSFALRPAELLRYFKDFLSRKSDRKLGHNPASSWAALIMMALAIGLGVTGFLMTTGGNKDALEDVHELMANAFIVVVIAHISGVVLHTLRHRDWIALSMVSGKKQSVSGEGGISQSYRGVAFLFVALVSVFVFHLGKNFDPRDQSLRLFGSTLQLGEAEGNEFQSEGSREDHGGSGEHDEDEARDRD